MSDRWIPFVIAALILALLAVAAYTNLEIYPTTIQQGPSREYRTNSFFMLEKWLGRTGHPVRTLGPGDASRILGARDKVALVLQPGSFDREDAAEQFEPWMEAGGWLLVSADAVPWGSQFLKSFGINIKIFENSAPEKSGDDDRPDFSPVVYFEVTEAGKQVFTMSDPWQDGELIRLVQIPLGAGGLVVFGTPLFMENEYLNREANARLAWELTGARAGKEHPGVLFVRGKRPVKSLFGKLADRGNLAPLGVSLALLIILGFWMVIPGFGLVLEEKTSPGRPIRDRFLAETRFLKRYRSLHIYPETYIHEIRRKLRGREAESELEAIEKALQKKRPLSGRELVRSLRILETMMERL